MINNIKISIIGLGYVGLPLAVEFAKKNQKIIGYDINKKRIESLKKFIDTSNEVSKNDLKKISKKILFTNCANNLKNSNFYIITVPTPILKNKKPDFSFLISASVLVSKFLKKGDTVVYESTVYPGATEEICLPILEKKSKLEVNKDFTLGYSPERINPGDKKHKISKIKKIVSASNQKGLLLINKVYSMIIKAGTFKTSSIKIAEASKIIENTQRDLNIALINELSQIFDKMNIDTHKVLDGASTKWNFARYEPGLVGGHCIGVDPYYLTYKAKNIGFNPKIILAGRKLNDEMPEYILKKLKKFIKIKNFKFKNPKLLLMGLTFKENCPDIRNSKVLKLHQLLVREKINIDCFDPWLKKNSKIKNINLISHPRLNYYDIIIISVKHDFFKKIGIKKIKSWSKKNSIIFDIKSIFPIEATDLRL